MKVAPLLGHLLIFAICSLAKLTLLRSILKSLLCIRRCVFYARDLNITFNFYGKQIKSKFGNKMYL